MSAPIYFFPALARAELVSIKGGLVPETLDRYGLTAILGDVKPKQFWATDHATLGPGGQKSGCLFSTNTGPVVAVRVGYYPDFQKWTMVRRDPELWVGTDKEYPPVPADLVRPKTIRGWKVTLADGNEYEIPVIRSPGLVTNLPRDMYYDASGAMKIEIKPDYQDLWDAAKDLWDRLISRLNVGDEFEWSDVLLQCLRFLGVNYRVGIYEQSVLRLIDTSEPVWLATLLAVLDVPFNKELEDTQKKSASLPAES
jgi:hypothetical protein